MGAERRHIPPLDCGGNVRHYASLLPFFKEPADVTAYYNQQDIFKEVQKPSRD